VVSRAFTPNSRIAPETRERVLEAARKLNHAPNSIASSLTTKRTNIVALILGNLANPFYVHVLHAFSKRMQAEGGDCWSLRSTPAPTATRRSCTY